MGNPGIGGNMKRIIPTNMTIAVTEKRFIAAVYSISQLKKTVVNFDASTSVLKKKKASLKQTKI